MKCFANRKRKCQRKGYIKRLSKGEYLAVIHTQEYRYRAVFETYQQAKSLMFNNGLWVEL